jgi:hypothetical protein
LQLGRHGLGLGDLVAVHRIGRGQHCG